MTILQQTPTTTVPGSLYARIRDELRSQIITGLYQPHDRLPSESEFMARYGVSRITVRTAISELEKEGILFKLAGKGIYVSKPKPFQSLGKLQGFAEAMAPHGHEIFNDVVSIETHPAGEEVAKNLRIPTGDPITEIRRVRYLNRAPVSFDITHVPALIGARLAREDLATRDIFLILENDYGIALGFADLAIDAVRAGEECADKNIAAHLQIATHLQINRGDPILRVARLTHSADGTPIDFEYLYCRSDNFQFRLRIER